MGVELLLELSLISSEDVVHQLLAYLCVVCSSSLASLPRSQRSLMQLPFLLCCSLWEFLLEDPTTSLHQLLPPILHPTHLSVVTTSLLELLQVSSTDVDLSLHRLVYLLLVLYKTHLDGVLFGISSWDVLSLEL